MHFLLQGNGDLFHPRKREIQLRCLAMNIRQHTYRTTEVKMGPTPNSVRYTLVAIVGILIATGIYLEKLDAKSFHQEETVSVVNKLSTVRARLEGVININLLSITGLIAEFSVNPDLNQEEFSRLAHVVLSQKTQIRNIAAARDMVITHMYPFKGNEKAFGLDYRKNKNQRAAALKAKEVGGVFVAGPVNLAQGGRGFIARAPVFVMAKDSTHGQGRFWGLISTVIDVDKLYVAAGLSDLSLAIEIAIRGRDSSGAEGGIFYGRPALFEDAPVLLEVSLPHGSWQLAATPIGGWTNKAPKSMAIRTAGAIVLLFIIGLIIYRERQRKGKELVEKALLESEERYELAVRQASIWDWNLETNIVYFSPMFSGALGYSPEEFSAILDDSIVSILHPDDVESYLDMINSHLNRPSTIFEHEHRFRLKSGNYRWFHARGQCVTDGDGKAIRSVGLLIDITERKQAEKALSENSAMLQGVFDNTPVCLNLKDTTGRYILLNKPYADWLGLPAKEIVGKRAGEFLENSDRANTLSEAEKVVLRTGEPNHRELKVLSHDGNTYDRSVIKFPIKSPDGKVMAVGTVATDITEIKGTEAALLRAKEDAEKANTAKSDFLANMSHELRTPLNSIIGFSQILESETFGPLGAAENREYIEIIRTSGEHLHEIIGDILDLAKIEAGEEALLEENVSVLQIVNRCLGIMSERAAKKRLSLTADIPKEFPLLYSDRLKITQVLINLLSNAIKFTPEKGEIKVEALLDEKGAILLVVQDTGVGIRPKDREIIFHAFSQVGYAHTRSHEGSGLGLALVKSLTELHGGTVKLQSDQGVGSTFTIVFPPERTVTS